MGTTLQETRLIPLPPLTAVMARNGTNRSFDGPLQVRIERVDDLGSIWGDEQYNGNQGTSLSERVQLLLELRR